MKSRTVLLLGVASGLSAFLLLIGLISVQGSKADNPSSPLTDPNLTTEMVTPLRASRRPWLDPGSGALAAETVAPRGPRAHQPRLLAASPVITRALRSSDPVGLDPWVRRVAPQMEPPKARPGVGRQPAAPGNVAPIGGIALQGVRTLATSPAITVCETYNYVWGYSASTNSTLFLTLKSGATIKGKGIARTDGVGYFSGEFFDQGRRVDIAPGDTVEVSTGSVTTIEVPTITGTVDPVTDIVSGTISGVSLPVSVTIDIWPAPTEIVQADMVKTVSTDASGNFSADFSDLVDIGADYVAKVTYTDANGNHVHSHLYVQAVNVYERFDRVFGYATPGASVNITVKDSGGITKVTTATTADPEDGHYDISFDVDIEPDDTVEVTADGTARSVVVADLTATMDLAGDDVLGTAPPTSTVRIYIWHLTDAQWRFYPKTVTSDGAGNYTADYSGILDIGRYDYVYACHPDGEGDETIVFYWPPLACVNVTYDNVWGYAAPGASITATLKDSLGNVKDIQTVTAEPWGYYEPGFSEDVVTGDRVEVSGGGVSATIPVQNLTADVDLAADTISGMAPASRPMIVRGWRSYAPGFNRALTSGADGTYALDLSGQVDLYNGYEGHVYYSQADDHKVFLHYHAPVVHVNQTHDGVWGFVAVPDIPVTITVKSVTDTLKASVVVTSNFESHFDAFYDGSVDIVPGDRVEVSTNPWSNTVEVVALSMSIDADADMVSGTAPPNSLVRVQVWDDEEGYTLVPTDPSGNFMADFSGEVDIEPGDTVRLGYENADHNEVYIYRYAPYARVNYTWDWVDGRASPGATVVVTVTRGGEVIGTGSDVAGGDGWFGTDVWGDGEHVDILPGDVVEAVGGDLSATMTVITITGDIDVDSDVVSGQMFGGSFPADGYLDIWQASTDNWYGWPMDIAGDGSFSVDLSGEFDIQRGDRATPWYIDPNGNWIGTVLFTPYLQANVNQSHDWVNGEATPDTTVYVTVTRGSEVIGTGQDHIESGTWFHINPEDEWGDRTDIQAGDVVEVATSGGLTATIEVITIAADIDPDNDIVSGQMSGGVFPADVDIEVWGRDGTGRRVQTDGDGNYSADLSPFDVKDGHEVAVWYINPDGHRVGIVRSALRVEVNITHDEIEGATVPEATVTITVTGSGVKGTASTVADEEGRYWTKVYTDGERVDIVPGDSVIVEAAGRTATVDAPDPFTAEIDVDADTVYGEGPVGAELRVDVYGYGDKWVTVGPDGTWEVWFGDRGDLQAGDRGEVNYYTDEGHVVQVRFYGPHLWFRANYTDDWVDGSTSPDATVWITATDGLGTLKGTRTTTAKSDGWFDGVDLWLDGQRTDLVPGDVITATSSDGSIASTTLITIKGAMDVEADTISGQMFGGVFPADGRLDFWQRASGQWFAWDFPVAGDGSYLIDLSGQLDVQNGDEAQVWYIAPDGNRPGIEVYAPFLQANVNQSHDWVNGEAAPEATVYVTVTRNSEVIGTGEDYTGGGTGFHINPEDEWGDRTDIQAGDVVEVATSEGLTATIEVIEMTGSVDAEANTVSGKIYGVSYPADVNVEVWEEDGPPDQETQTNDQGDYSVDFSPFDIKDGHAVAIWYVRPDGHRVGLVRCALHIGTNIDNDDVWGDTIPEATVSLTLTGSSVKGAATAQADKDGRYWTEFFSDGQEVDILFGDTIDAEVEGKTATLQLIALSANTDVDNDEIYGIAPPNLNVWVEVWDYDGKWTTSDESGYYNAWVGDIVDLEVGHRGEVGYENEDGHRVEILFTTLFGDLDCDCEVDVADIMQVASRWRMTDEDPHWDPRYDLDDNGIITIVDIMLVVAVWGSTCP